MSIVKNVNKFSLFLFGLIVAFNAVACDCKDDKAKKVKQGEKVTLTFKFTADASEDAVLDADAFEENGKTLKDLKVGAVKKEESKDIELKAKGDAKKGEKTVKITSADKKTTFADCKVTVEEK